MLEPEHATLGTEVSLLWGEPGGGTSKPHHRTARADRQQGGGGMWKPRATAMPTGGAPKRGERGMGAIIAHCSS